ncbi:unnamed protein product [Danaus chrysippus]|uniref:(African queen) hypothetical protein n=1 Tax=Danaus chrysippus TaxID=151541 RepID=A0A8J2QW23_9NEOP|nr:unnamed protein product [Danaus chrysippus]
MSQILKCSVNWCDSTSENCTENGEDVTFHTFPKCQNIRDTWIDACKNDDEDWKPSQDSVICSRHFTDDCFRQTKPRRMKFKSTPTLHLPKKIVWERSLRDQVMMDYLRALNDKRRLIKLLKEKLLMERRHDRRKT